MQVDSSASISRVTRGSQRKKWTVKEKKIVLAALRKHGHDNLQHFVVNLPHRTEYEIKRLLNKFKASAERKLCSKFDVNVANTLSTIHPWMPFLNKFCNHNPQVHEHLVAFILPFIERYKKHPQPAETGTVDFKWAYRALFQSLREQKFPEDIGLETLSMIYASLNQLFDDIRTEQINCEDILRNCINRCFEGEKLRKISREINVVTLPEVNILGFSMDEVNQLCRNK